MRRREVLSLAPLAWTALRAQGSAESLLLVSQPELDRASRNLAQPPGKTLERVAARARKEGPWSVTFHRPAGLDIAPNDYFSEGPYWWPDPKDPKAPYIRKDGERNPDRFTAHHDDIGKVGVSALALALWGRMKNDASAFQRMDEIVRVWFVDPKTRMNPHLNYGQAVRGRNMGRGAGIIDSRPLIWAAFALRLAEGQTGWSAETSSGLRHWLAEYLQWLTTSKIGLDESKARNNHGTWYTAQCAALAIATGNREVEAAMWRKCRELVTSQLRPDGSAPQEEARTRSLSYSAMNLDGFSLICRMASLRGENLWAFQNPSGGSVAKSVEFLLPYVADPASWKKQQITPHRPEENYFLALAGWGLNKPEWLAAQKKLPCPANPWHALIHLLLA